MENYKREVEANKEKALEVCEPIQTNRTPNSIEIEITQIERRINEEEEQQGNEEVISTTYKQKKDALDRVRKEIGQMKAYIDKLDEVSMLTLLRKFSIVFPLHTIPITNCGLSNFLITRKKILRDG